MAVHWQVGRHSLIGAGRACQAIKAAIKITSRTSSDAGHMAASLTRTNCTSSQLPALSGSILPRFCLFRLLIHFPCIWALCPLSWLVHSIYFTSFFFFFICIVCQCAAELKVTTWQLCSRTNSSSLSCAAMFLRQSKPQKFRLFLLKKFGISWGYWGHIEQGTLI